MRSDRDYLADILTAISKVQKYAGEGRTRFETDELLQTFMIHQILIIGEAAHHVGEGYRSRAPEIEWPVIVGMRNQLVHGYFEINRAEVWKAVEDDLPKLRAGIERLLSLP